VKRTCGIVCQVDHLQKGHLSGVLPEKVESLLGQLHINIVLANHGGLDNTVSNPPRSSLFPTYPVKGPAVRRRRVALRRP
jgi:hypothetical protein